MQIAHPDMSDFSDYDKNLYVVCAGYNKACDADLGCVRENGRTDWFLYYVIKGKSKYAFKKNEHIAVADDVVFYNYKEPQDYVHLAEYGTEVYWIHFKGNLVQSLLKELGINQSMRVHVDENLSFYFKTIINLIFVFPTFPIVCSSLV